MRLLYRAGWPDRRGFRRMGRWWLRVGPYVLGSTASWDRSEAP